MEKTQKYLIENLVYPLWNDKSLEVIETFFAKDVDIRTTFASGKGLDIFKKSVCDTFNTFPNLKIHLDEVIQEGNKHIYKWTGQGTHSGSLMCLPATGREIHFSGVVFGEIKNGYISTYHSFSNIPHVLRSLYASNDSLSENPETLTGGSSNSLLELYQAIKKLARFPLTRREIECLTAWIRGCTIKETAKRMGGLSERTIQTYRENIKKKFGVYNYQQVLHLIQHNGLLSQLLYT